MKCRHKGCDKETDGSCWCEEHLNELGDFIEENPIGCVPKNDIDVMKAEKERQGRAWGESINKGFKILVSSNEVGHGSQIDIPGAEFGNVLVGDIVAKGKDCVIERKEVNDFIGSCTDSHMWEQAKNMRLNYKRQVVIISGYLDDKHVYYKNLRHIPHAYKSIAALIRMGISVLIVRDDKMLSSISEAILREAEPRDPTIAIKRVEKSSKHSLIQAIPGVGQSKAKALLEKYGSVRAISGVDIGELSEFKVNNRKIGEATAKKIHEALN